MGGHSPRWKQSGIYAAKIIGPEGKRVQIIYPIPSITGAATKRNGGFKLLANIQGGAPQGGEGGWISAG